MDIHFEGQAVVVTGAARGIGGGIVEGFVERGARVWACDVLDAELAALKARAQPKRGGALQTRTVDLTQSHQVDAFVREVEGVCGAVDVLVHVAGGVRGQLKRPLEEVSDDDWRAIYAVNVEGAFFVSRAVVPGMKKNGGGRIVVIASRAGLGVSLTGIQSYATAKAAQLGLVRQLAHELGPSGITVNAVAPGFLRTSPDYERQWQSYGSARPEGDDRTRRHATPGRAARHRARRDVPGLALRVVDHRAGAARDRQPDRLSVGRRRSCPHVRPSLPSRRSRNSPGSGPSCAGAASSSGCAPAARSGLTSWPGGARCAVALSFDSDHETGELREGGESIGRLSQGQYGNRAGIPRILRLLQKHAIPATFYVPAVSAMLYPDEQRRVVAEGHEIGIHGWIHERNSILPEAAERDLQMRSADALEKVSGQRPVGIRTPSWDFSPHTLAITRDMGLLYDSSLMADDDCYELVLDGQPTGVVELPVEWIRDDAVYFNMNRFAALRPYTPPSAVLEVFRREFDAAYAEGGLFQLTMHPHIIGHRSRLMMLEELIRHIRAHAGIWFATHAEVARYVKENNP